MTPAMLFRLFVRLQAVRIADYIHREMCSGLTTSAILNSSFSPPEKPVPWTDFAPNYNADKKTRPAELSEAQKQLISEHNIRALQLAAEMKAEAELERHSRTTEPLGQVEA